MSRVAQLVTMVIVLVIGPMIVLSQNSAPAKPTLTKADYDKFESINASTLSSDGKWLAYVVNRGERGAARGRGSEGPAGDLHYRAAASAEEKTVAAASAPTFTSNSRWLLYTSTPARGGARAAGARAGRGNAEAPTGPAPSSVG